jgi:mycothiol synthase
MTVDWRPLAKDDLPAVQALMRRVLATDGGLPQAASEGFLWARFGAGIVAAADGVVVAAAGYTVDRGGVGAVDPDWRARGLGTHLLDWMSETSGPAGDLLTVSTESLTDDADDLFRRRGLRQTFGEDVMRIDLRTAAPDPEVPGAILSTWSRGLEERFFACYRAAFADRPGFPGWTREQWVDWISDGLHPQWTVLVTRGGEDVGFVASGTEDEDAWIVQVGVVPGARAQGLGAGLTAEALRRMRADGQTSALLDVNLNNPGAARVYERLGFVRIGRRARYTR